MVNNHLTFESLSPQEQDAVTQLKQRMAGRMKPEMYSDLSLFVRFLKARDLNLNAAEEMLKNHLEWRKANQVDTILTNYNTKEVLQKFAPFNNIGIDKEGSPVIYFNLGCLDSRGILKSCRKCDIQKFCIQRLEEDVAILEKQSIKLGRTVDKWTMILNFANLSFSVATHKQTLEVIGSLISMYEANYPERLKVAFCINASLYFTISFAVAKHFISEKTYSKFRFYGDEGWIDDLLELVGEDALPAFLGGKRTDPDGDPLCKSFVTHGGLVHPRYFINRKENTIANLPDVQKLTVTRMSKTYIELTVKELDTYLEWEFQIKSRDIAFALHYKSNKNESIVEELIPSQRIDTYMCSETGTIKCEKPGVYIIVLDNTYSWLFRKEIFYRVAVVKR